MVFCQSWCNDFGVYIESYMFFGISPKSLPIFWSHGRNLEEECGLKRTKMSDGGAGMLDPRVMKYRNGRSCPMCRRFSPENINL